MQVSSDHGLLEVATGMMHVQHAFAIVVQCIKDLGDGSHLAHVCNAEMVQHVHHEFQL